MAFTFLSGATASGNSQSVTTSAIDTTGASVITVAVSQFLANGTLTDSEGNTWTEVPESAENTNVTARIFYCISPNTDATHTFTFEFITGDLGQRPYPVIRANAFSADKPVEYDQVETNTLTGTSIAPGSITPSEEINLHIAVQTAGNADGTDRTINDSFTESHDVNYQGGVSMLGHGGYKIQATVTAANPTLSGTISRERAAIHASFVEGVFTIAPPVIASIAQVFAPSSVGTAIQPPLIAATAQVFSPLIQGPIIPTFIPSAAQIFGPNLLQPEAIILDAPIASIAQVFTPQIVEVITPTLIPSIAQVFNPQLTGQNQIPLVIVGGDIMRLQDGDFLADPSGSQYATMDTLGDYVTTIDLGLAIADFVDISELDAVLADYYTSAETDGAIAAATTDMVESSGTITDNAIVRGDGGSRGVQDSTATIADNGDVTVNGRIVQVFTGDNISLTTDTTVFGSITTAANNIGIGDGVLVDLTSGNFNVCVGVNAGGNITTGSSNFLFGSGTGIAITVGQGNVLMGTSVGQLLLDSDFNLALGHNCMQNATSSVDQNVSLGYQTGRVLGGSFNLFAGARSGEDVVATSTSVFLGFGSGRISNGQVNGSNMVAIGFNTFCTASNQVVLGNAAVTSTILRGDVTMGAAQTLTLGVFNDGNRPAAGTAGRIIFNTTDGNINIDDGTNWILPDGTTT